MPSDLRVASHGTPQVNSEYHAYLESPRWKKLAKAVRMRAKGQCEICLRAQGTDCAHLTYERIFHEPMSDLLWLCWKCHRRLDSEECDEAVAHR